MRTNAGLEPGDFWNIPTRRGGWQCCGVVLLNGRSAGSRVLLVAALLDWCEPRLPDCRSIAEVDLVDVGVIHVGAIGRNGGEILGNCPVVIPPDLSPFDRDFTRTYDTWSQDYIELLAHQHFGRHFPSVPEIAAERPDAFK